MPTAQKAKKTFTKKKAAPQKVVKKAVKKTIAAVKAAPKKVQSTRKAPVQPIEKRISWLADNEAARPEKAPSEPTLSEMPSNHPVDGEPVAPAITSSVGPEAHDTWPNPAVLATPDTTTPPVQAPTAPVTASPVTPPVSPVEPQPAEVPVAATATPSPQIQMAPPVTPAATQPEVAVSENVLGPNFDGASQGGGKKKLLLLFIVVFLFVGLLTSGFFYYLSTQKGKLPNFTQLPTPTPKEIAEPTATPTAAVKVDLTKYTIEVLNGSGTAGEAGKASKLLENTGFAGIDTGNADSYDYTDTEVQIGKDVPTAVFDAVKKSLEETYSVIKSKDKPTDKYDIVVIVGSSEATGSSSSSAKTTKDEQ